MWRVTSVHITVASVVGGRDAWNARETSIAACCGVIGDGREGVKRGAIFGGGRVEWTDRIGDTPKGFHAARIFFTGAVFARCQQRFSFASSRTVVQELCSTAVESEYHWLVRSRVCGEISSLVAVWGGISFRLWTGPISSSPSGSLDNRYPPPITSLRVIDSPQVNYPMKSQRFWLSPCPGRGGENNKRCAPRQWLPRQATNEYISISHSLDSVSIWKA